MGILKQAHTRLLFILTRCTRLVQFHKESGYDEDHILGLHQLSDLGVYTEHLCKFAQQDISGQLSGGKEVSKIQRIAIERLAHSCNFLTPFACS